MNLLYSNDRPGVHAPSWYAATANPSPDRPSLEGKHRADIAIVGAGYTGLSAALHLASAGYKVAVLEAHRAGWGASGRNGGQLGTGQRVEQADLEAKVGEAHARQLWDLALEATGTAKSLISQHSIDCDLKPGIIHTLHKARYLPDARHEVDFMAERYDYALDYLDKAALGEIVESPAYHGGVVDPGGSHLHPLNYALGLAQAAENAGATIYESSEVSGLTEGAEITLETANGAVTAPQVLLACNGYLGDLNANVAGRVMPINNFIVATEPLEEHLARRVIANGMAIADSKFVVNYYRLSRDNRLLFGGRESYGYRFPSDIKGFVRKAMLAIYPYLADTRIDYGWGGTLAITMNRLPYLRRLRPNLYSASGYSGHGVAMATLSGKLVAEAMQGQAEKFDVMAAIKTPGFPGGPAFRSPLLVLAMLWYTLRDRL
ncbi:MAG: FAD-binding oxidoreductase [Paracoccaceae bacterium]|nr:FAD-binding oxidoreductase [Paracoccaceae bacterium]MDG1369427.1 FAD-binding oxidoreductase [Paracoccaceae bacterium]